MNTFTSTEKRLSLEPNNPHTLANLCGQLDENLRQIEQRLEVRIHNRSNQFSLHGGPSQVRIASQLLKHLYKEAKQGQEITPELVHLFLQEANRDAIVDDFDDELHANEVVVKTKKLIVKPRGDNQQNYIKRIADNDINFGVGPAGTGKTFLAVAAAAQALEQDEVRRIMLVRPAVEAGEKLGFLPGDLAQKIDPYLRPLYDALYEMLGFEKVAKLIENNVIEIAPLAFMRGRTLNNAYIILDESQNTTREQMKMFLTRIGFGSTAIITGDITQIDLPGGANSGLKHAIEVLSGVKGISFTHFDSKDVVRHPLVQRIVEAYDHHEEA
ncbi:phosphate starvation-inducible PhoH-like protein [Sinobacterium caligoides]|uniref:PhoH-like protein n=1 Tax=Sinobacterium caligoides TaxID=933926 RepID=A0A3N2DG77_9GAMM|nr:PhoH family protein [Sinobacterium caligoides]ROR98731.1 phosphate starvation-inducible PhoH-like protein [Sinobacterium caligoides]